MQTARKSAKFRIEKSTRWSVPRTALRIRLLRRRLKKLVAFPTEPLGYVHSRMIETDVPFLPQKYPRVDKIVSITIIKNTQSCMCVRVLVTPCIFKWFEGCSWFETGKIESFFSYSYKEPSTMTNEREIAPGIAPKSASVTEKD